MHCIDVIIADKSLDGFKSYHNSEQNVYIYPNTKKTKQKLNYLKWDFMIAQTDYFGGAGEQSAFLYKKGLHITSFSDNTSINVIAKLLFKLEFIESDEFDALHLNMFRSNKNLQELCKYHSFREFYILENVTVFDVISCKQNKTSRRPVFNVNETYTTIYEILTNPTGYIDRFTSSKLIKDDDGCHHHLEFYRHDILIETYIIRFTKINQIKKYL